MNWNEIMAQPVTKVVTKRYKVTEEQDRRLRDLSTRLNIPESALIRMAVDQFLPRTTNQGFTEKGIKDVWNCRNV